MLLVSIIIPSYNRAHFISETLDNVLAQTYTNWECLIVDDGSTDNTPVIVNEYCEKDDRISFYQRPEHRLKGANTCRNIGVEKSKGKFLQFLDSDDLLSPQKIELQLKALEDNSDVAYGGYRYFTETNNINTAKKIPKPYYKDYGNGSDFLEALGAYDSFVPSHAYLMRKKCIESSGKWLETLKSNQDGEFFCRVLLKANSIKYVSNSEVYYRIHNTSRVSSLDNFQTFERRIKSWKIIQEHLRPYGLSNGMYIEGAKKIIFREITKSAPILIFKHFGFFRNQIMTKFKKNRFIKLNEND